MSDAPTKVLGQKLEADIYGFKVTVQGFTASDDPVGAKCVLADFTIGQPFMGDDGLSASGTLRWDGCINWNDGGGTMNHFCHVEHLVGWAEAMRCVWVLGAEVIDGEFEIPKSMADVAAAMWINKQVDSP
jgi:hypothetical protein